MTLLLPTEGGRERQATEVNQDPYGILPLRSRLWRCVQEERGEEEWDETSENRPVWKGRSWIEQWKWVGVRCGKRVVKRGLERMLGVGGVGGLETARMEPWWYEWVRVSSGSGTGEERRSNERER